MSSTATGCFCPDVASNSHSFDGYMATVPCCLAQNIQKLLTYLIIQYAPPYLNTNCTLLLWQPRLSGDIFDQIECKIIKFRKYATISGSVNFTAALLSPNPPRISAEQSKLYLLATLGLLQWNFFMSDKDINITVSKLQCFFNLVTGSALPLVCSFCCTAKLSGAC